MRHHRDEGGGERTNENWWWCAYFFSLSTHRRSFIVRAFLWLKSNVEGGKLDKKKVKFFITVKQMKKLWTNENF